MFSDETKDKINAAVGVGKVSLQFLAKTRSISCTEN